MVRLDTKARRRLSRDADRTDPMLTTNPYPFHDTGALPRRDAFTGRDARPGPILTTNPYPFHDTGVVPFPDSTRTMPVAETMPGPQPATAPAFPRFDASFSTRDRGSAAPPLSARDAAGLPRWDEAPGPGGVWSMPIERPLRGPFQNMPMPGMPQPPRDLGPGRDQGRVPIQDGIRPRFARLQLSSGGRMGSRRDY